jgi:hypothetical protein
MMLMSYTRFTKDSDRISIKAFIFGISNKVGIFIDKSNTLVSNIALAFMVSELKNFLFGIISKTSDYFYHTSTSKLKVMIDFSFSISYPLVNRLGGSNGREGKSGKGGKGFRGHNPDEN